MPRAVFLLLLALAVPSASAATAFLPLAPGDSVHATDGPADRDLRIEQVFGQSVAVIETSEPALVGVQVRHANNSLTTQVLHSEGVSIAELQLEVQALQTAVSQAMASLQNLSQDLDQTRTASTNQAQQIQSAIHNASVELEALDQRAATIQAAATESNQLVRNLEMPDLEPIEQRLDETQSESEQLSSRLTAVTVLAAFTLMGVLGALLHTAWPHMRHWLPPRDAPDDQEDDLDEILAEEQSKAEALAVELVPDAPGVAGHLETELRDKLTPPSEEE